MDHTDLVRQIKASLEARGVSLSGPCGAFAITKRVAWALRREGAGLLDKPSGNNCLGYATDIIVYPSGQHYDILIGSGSENGPAWQDAGVVDPSRWRPAVDPGGSSTPPTPPTPPEAPPSDAIADAIAAIHATALQVDQMRGIIVEIAATLHTLRAEAQTVSRQAGAALTRLEQTLGRIEQQTRRIR